MLFLARGFTQRSVPEKDFESVFLSAQGLAEVLSNDLAVFHKKNYSTSKFETPFFFEKIVVGNSKVFSDLFFRNFFWVEGIL